MNFSNSLSIVNIGIVEQLHKLLAKISLLALMMNFEPHREVVLKVLKQAYVPHNASIEKIDAWWGM